MEKKISSDLIRGHVDTIILKTLYDGDKYGLEIIKVIGERSGGNYQVKQPTLYSALTRLSKQGLIESYWGESIQGGRRKYFKLTKVGKQLSEQNMSKWEYSRTVIDKLISEKEFDLQAKPPENIDFNLLKSGISHKPITPQAEKPIDLEKNIENKLSSLKKYESERDNRKRLDGLYKAASVPPEPAPEQTQKPQPPQAPQPQKTDAAKAIIPTAQSKIDFDDLIEKAEGDGIKLRICSSRDIKALRGGFFNKGVALFYSMLVFSLICAIEVFVIYLSLKTKLDIIKTEAIFAAAVFALFPAAAGIAALFGYGKSAHRENKHFTYSGAFIFALNISFFYLAFILLSKVSVSGAGIIKKVLIPIALALQLPIFVRIFKAIAKG